MSKETGVLYTDMSDEDYFNLPSIDQSQLKAFLRNPADWGYERLYGGCDPTPAMRFGTAFHAYLLETGNVVAMPEDMSVRTKAGKEWKAEQEQAGNIIVSHTDMQLLDRMKAGIERDPERLEMIRQGMCEKAIEWVDKKTGITLKAKLDLIPRDVDYLVDIKTAASAQPDDFARSAYIHGYHIQAEFYRTAVAQIAPERLNRTRRIATGMQFWVFEKTNACDWRPYVISADSPMAEHARTSIRQALNLMRNTIDTAEAEGYGEGLDAAAKYSIEHGYPKKKALEVDFTDWQLRDAELAV